MFRTRSRGSIDGTDIDTYTASLNCSNVETVSHNFATKLYQGSTQATADVVTPNFKKLSGVGAVINNPFVSITTVESGSCGGEDVATKTGTCSSYKRYRYGPWASRASCDFQPSAWWKQREDAITLAGTRAWANVAPPDLQGLVEMAEAKKMARLIPGVVRTTMKNLQQASKSKHRSAKGVAAANVVASNWLAFRYGLKPMMYLINDLLTVLENKTRPVRLTARGSADTEVFEDETTSSSAGYFTNVETFKRQTISSQVRAGVLYEHYLAFDALGLSPDQLINTAWELTPLSFVFDWFVNVQDFLAAYSPRIGVNVLASWTTVTDYQNSVVSNHTTANSVSGWNVTANRSNSHLVSRRTKERRPHATRGLVSKLSEIRFEKDKDFMHAADAMALFVTYLRPLIGGR